MRAAYPGFDANPDLVALRRALADRIEADLAALDALGGDADLEPYLSAPEDAAISPFTRYGSQEAWGAGSSDDREEENEHGTEIDRGEDGDDNGIGDCDGLAEQFPVSAIGYSFGLAV